MQRFTHLPLSRTKPTWLPTGTNWTRDSPTIVLPDLTWPSTRTVFPGSTPIVAPRTTPPLYFFVLPLAAFPPQPSFSVSLLLGDLCVGALPPTSQNTVSVSGSVSRIVLGGHAASTAKTAAFFGVRSTGIDPRKRAAGRRSGKTLKETGSAETSLTCERSSQP